MSRRNAKSINSRISSKEIPLGPHAHAYGLRRKNEANDPANHKLPPLSKSQSKWRWALKTCYWRSQLGYFIHFKSVFGDSPRTNFLPSNLMMQEVKAVEGLLLLLAYWKMFFWVSPEFQGLCRSTRWKWLDNFAWVEILDCKATWPRRIHVRKDKAIHVRKLRCRKLSGSSEKFEVESTTSETFLAPDPDDLGYPIFWTCSHLENRTNTS